MGSLCRNSALRRLCSQLSVNDGYVVRKLWRIHKEDDRECSGRIKIA